MPSNRGLVVDVGADHGHVAHAVGAVATERRSGRRGRSDIPWVITDGLAGFRSVDVAIIAGMGARTIAGILERGPVPRVAVLHAQDDPPWLRRWLASAGWRIDAEGLAPEARRFAEVIRATRGEEPATGLDLEFGPRLLEGTDPLVGPHLRQLHGWWSGILDATRGRAPAKARAATERLEFLEHTLSKLSSDPEGSHKPIGQSTLTSENES